MKKLEYNSSFEGEFTKYYEMYFYSDNTEMVDKTIDYIGNIWSDYRGDSDKGLLIDIGCGTGIYETGFAELFEKVVAVDLSKDMIEYAAANHSRANVEYGVQNICESPVKGEADIVVSLSHVIGYQLSDRDLDSFIRNSALSLKKDGLFVFNFYNEPAILGSELKPRKKEKQCDNVRIVRDSSLAPILSERALQMNYDYHISDKEEIEIVIREKMRYFSVNELEKCLMNNGMKMLAVKTFLSDSDLTDSEWNGCIIASKV